MNALGGKLPADFYSQLLERFLFHSGTLILCVRARALEPYSAEQIGLLQGIRRDFGLGLGNLLAS